MKFEKRFSEKSYCLIIEISLYYSIFLDCFSTGPNSLPSGCSGMKFRNKLRNVAYRRLALQSSLSPDFLQMKMLDVKLLF